MMDIERLRKQFDEFLEERDCDMTSDEVLEMALKIEDELFER